MEVKKLSTFYSHEKENLSPVISVTELLLLSSSSLKNVTKQVLAKEEKLNFSCFFQKFPTFLCSHISEFLNCF